MGAGGRPDRTRNRTATQRFPVGHTWHGVRRFEFHGAHMARTNSVRVCCLGSRSRSLGLALADVGVRVGRLHIDLNRQFTGVPAISVNSPPPPICGVQARRPATTPAHAFPPPTGTAAGTGARRPRHAPAGSTHRLLVHLSRPASMLAGARWRVPAEGVCGGIFWRPKKLRGRGPGLRLASADSKPPRTDDHADCAPEPGSGMCGRALWALSPSLLVYGLFCIYGSRRHHSKGFHRSLRPEHGGWG